MARFALSFTIFLILGVNFSFAQEQPKVLRAVAPKKINLESNYCGKVVIRVEIDFAGKVEKAKAISGHPKLRITSETVALKWLFSETTEKKQLRNADLIFNYECEYRTGNDDISTIYNSPYEIVILFPKEFLKESESN